MPPTKRKISDGRGEDSHGRCEESQSGGSKRKRTELEDAELMQELYETLKNHKTEDGRILCELFIRAPKRRTDPEYYNLVSNPIDLQKIQQKLKSEEYKSVNDLTNDIELLVENAKLYYRPDTQEYQDACDLLELYIENKMVLLGEEMAVNDSEEEDEDDEEAFDEDPEEKSRVDVKTEPVRSLRERRYTYRDFLFPKVLISEKQNVSLKTTRGLTKNHTRSLTKDDVIKEEKDADDDEKNQDDDDTSYEELFAAVVTAKDGERSISEMFKILPSRKKYPDYYDVIQDPIDLKTIARRIQNGVYKNLDDMVKDLNQMVHNAKNFNETGSQIYRDAVTLKKIVSNKKHELDLQRNSQRPVRSERIRTRKAHTGQRLSVAIAALETESENEEDATPALLQHHDAEDMDSGGEESYTESDEDPMWLLYRTVKGLRNSLGQRISEPFLRLPSKRVYPDYYEEIKKPMSLLKIQKKLKSGSYRDLDQLAAEIDLVFENAKRYNMDESKLYKDAVKLQGVMRQKMKEIKDRKTGDVVNSGSAETSHKADLRNDAPSDVQTSRKECNNMDTGNACFLPAKDSTHKLEGMEVDLKQAPNMVENKVDSNAETNAHQCPNQEVNTHQCPNKEVNTADLSLNVTIQTPNVEENPVETNTVDMVKNVEVTSNALESPVTLTNPASEVCSADLVGTEREETELSKSQVVDGSAGDPDSGLSTIGNPLQENINTPQLSNNLVNSETESCAALATNTSTDDEQNPRETVPSSSETSEASHVCQKDDLDKPQSGSQDPSTSRLETGNKSSGNDLIVPVSAYQNDSSNDIKADGKIPEYDSGIAAATSAGISAAASSVSSTEGQVQETDNSITQQSVGESENAVVKQDGGSVQVEHDEPKCIDTENSLSKERLSPKEITTEAENSVEVAVADMPTASADDKGVDGEMDHLSHVQPAVSPTESVASNQSISSAHSMSSAFLQGLSAYRPVHSAGMALQQMRGFPISYQSALQGHSLSALSNQQLVAMNQLRVATNPMLMPLGQMGYPMVNQALMANPMQMVRAQPPKHQYFMTPSGLVQVPVTMAMQHNPGAGYGIPLMQAQPSQLTLLNHQHLQQQALMQQQLVNLGQVQAMHAPVQYGVPQSSLLMNQALMLRNSAQYGGGRFSVPGQAAPQLYLPRVQIQPTQARLGSPYYFLNQPRPHT